MKCYVQVDYLILHKEILLKHLGKSENVLRIITYKVSVLYYFIHN